MKICCISDTHNKQDFVNIPEADVLIHAGDFTVLGRDNEIARFHKWFTSIPVPFRILVAGNHDIGLQRRNSFSAAQDLVHGGGIFYLENSTVSINGLTFYGSPYTPTFGYGWAFQHNEEQRKEHWANAPKADVVICHGPPLGYLDRNQDGENCGCKYLGDYIRRAKPKLLICGHIHEGYGEDKIIHDCDGSNTHIVNASICDLAYYPGNKPVVIEV